MVKMIEREWVRVVVLCWGSLESKIRKLVIRLKDSPLAYVVWRVFVSFRPSFSILVCLEELSENFD